jgi:hypothetical protein
VKWKDTRPPVWVGLVRGKLVTIYDMAAYEQSKLDYPDDPNQNKLQVVKARAPFEKKKQEARYNWVVKLEQPLKGKVS